MKDYILGSHNSWSYLVPKKWWMRLIRFVARCQDVDIEYQYGLGVRCFDLRVRVDKGVEVAHGIVRYDITIRELLDDLKVLDGHKDCFVRVLHEARNKRQYTQAAVRNFRRFCEMVEERFPNVKFWCGRNLYDWSYDYDFGDEPSCEEKYSSVCAPKIDDIWPRWYAMCHNEENLKEGTDKDILLIDFVNIQ